MENKKNKKKLFAIIAASALAFVLTIALSVSITLAYFGDTKTGTASVTLGEKLQFKGDNISVAGAGSASLTGLLPGSQVDVQGTGTIAQTSTKAYLRASVKGVAGTADDTTSFTLGEATTTYSGGYFTKSGDYYYLVSADGGDDLLEINPTTDTNVTIQVKLTVSTGLKNADKDKTFTITVTMEIIQSANIGTTISDVSTLWTSSNVG